MDFIQKHLLEYGVDPNWVDTLSVFVLIVFIALICFIANFITKQVIIRFITHMLRKNKFKWDHILLKQKVFHKLSHFVPAIIIYNFASSFPTYQTAILGVPVTSRFIACYVE